ncbi:PC4/YdbC family ssDNA-binding protein [Lysinibacillus pakistanensis]|uniref:YdbC family protein n=1 Tax=Lysinibacillus TaxID=400634 RepID=UPI00258021DD|nr:MULTISPECIES: PC4/YdbC family ssDNA-binding protein [Lysinibacillus]
MADIKYEIIETLAVLSEGNKGWKKELNLISWNGREAKFDIRDWSEDHTKMGKGVTLSPAEMKILAETLTKLSTSDI